MNLAPHAKAIAEALLGEPNKALSSKSEWRFGTKGSLAVQVAGEKAGRWFDHEAKEGGGPLDLVMRERGLDKAGAFAWLREQGIGDDGSPPQGRYKITGTWIYLSRARDPLYRVIRRDCPGKPKKFFQERFDPATGSYRSGLEGIARVPYRLPELLEAPLDTPVLIPEGERKVDALVKAIGELGFVATCNSEGAGKFQRDFGGYFEGRPVVLLPDNDAAGRNHVRKVAEVLKPLAAALSVVELPGLGPKGDVVNWLANGGAPDELVNLIEAAPSFEEWAADHPAPEPHGATNGAGPGGNAADPAAGNSASKSIKSVEIKFLSERQPKSVEWCWFPYIPAGMITIEAGKGEAGKGHSCVSIVRGVTTGGLMPNGEKYQQPRKVLWIELEDPIEQVLIPRMVAQGVDRSLVAEMAVADFLEVDLKALIKEHDFGLMVLSPLISCLEIEQINKDHEVRRKLATLQAAIEGTRCGVIGIGHLNKKADLAALERVIGSVAFVNYVRSVIAIAKDKEDETARRLMHIKYNCSVKGADLMFRTKNIGPTIGKSDRDQYVTADWWTPEAGNADPDTMFGAKQPENSDKPPSATEWLSRYLKGRGEVIKEDVIEAGSKADIKARTLDQAIVRNPQRFMYRQEGFPARSWWSLR